MAIVGVCTSCPVVFKDDEGALYISAYLADVAATLGPWCRPGGFGASAPREAAADSPN